MKYVNAIAGAFIGFLVCSVSADRVVLTSGQIFEGRILSETEYEVEIQVGRSEDGGIRMIHVIDRELVQSMSRGAVRVPVREVTGNFASPEPSEPADPKPPPVDTSSVESYLEQGSGMLREGNYDEAIERYRVIANHPKLTAMSRQGGEEARRALELRRRALRLMITAVEGKAEYLEERGDQAEEAVDTRLRQAEEALRDAEREADSNESGDYVAMRSRQRTRGQTGLDAYRTQVEEARERVQAYRTWARRNALEIRNLEAEQELLEEQEDQLSDTLKRLR